MSRLQLRRSPMEFLLLLIVHGAALAGVGMANLPTVLALLLGLLVCCHGGWRLRFWCLHNCREILLGRQLVQLQLSRGTVECGLPRLRYVSEFLLLLQFQSLPGSPVAGRFDFLLFPDSLAAGQWRRLQRLLRIDYQAVAGKSGARG